MGFFFFKTKTIQRQTWWIWVQEAGDIPVHIPTKLKMNFKRTPIFSSQWQCTKYYFKIICPRQDICMLITNTRNSFFFLFFFYHIFVPFLLYLYYFYFHFYNCCNYTIIIPVFYVQFFFYSRLLFFGCPPFTVYYATPSEMKPVPPEIMYPWKIRHSQENISLFPGFNRITSQENYLVHYRENELSEQPVRYCRIVCTSLPVKKPRGYSGWLKTPDRTARPWRSINL